MNAKKTVIYTAVFGGDNCDCLLSHFPGFDFICFTDKKKISTKWKIKLVKPNLSPEILNRKYKILAHRYLKNYENSMYVDANIRILKNPKNLIHNVIKNSNFAVSKHFLRECLYDEALAVLKSSRFNNGLIFRQILNYAVKGMPQNYGLSENSIIIRKHNKSNIKKFMERWWYEITRKSHRDQISLPFLLWKYKFQVLMLNENKRQGNHFSFKEKKISKDLFSYIKGICWIILFYLIIKIILKFKIKKIYDNWMYNYFI